MNRIKEGLPLHPSQEIKPEYISSGLTARACVYASAPARKRERWLKRKVATAVADAIVAFAGTPSDEKLWANFAWRRGYGKLLDAIDDEWFEENYTPYLTVERNGAEDLLVPIKTVR